MHSAIWWGMRPLGRQSLFIHRRRFMLDLADDQNFLLMLDTYEGCHQEGPRGRLLQAINWLHSVEKLGLLILILIIMCQTPEE